MKRIFKQGEEINTPKMEEDQVSCILAVITNATNETQEEVKKHSTQFFQQVNGLLQSLTNPILEKVPQTDVLQRATEISTGKRVLLVYIPPCALVTRSEDVDATMQQFDVITLDLNELLMQTLA